MNSIRLKHKTLFYSIFIHILIIILIAFLVYWVDKMNRNYVLVDLDSVDISSPALDCFCEPEVKEVKVEEASPVTTAEVTPIKKKIKKSSKQEIVLKKKVEVAQVVPLSMPQEVKKVEKPIEEEAVVKQVKSLKTSIEKSSSSIVTNKQSISYEARYMEDNLALINAMIKKNLSYPRIAKKRGVQGKVIVFFTLNLDGTLSDIKTSGEVASILKKSAVKTIEKASVHFPSTKETLSLQIPIVYKLR